MKGLSLRTDFTRFSWGMRTRAAVRTYMLAFLLIRVESKLCESSSYGIT
jgi:hypothetical protein